MSNRVNKGRALKWIGIAGLASLTATGVLVARNERARRAYTSDELRSRLRQRYAEAEAGGLRAERASRAEVTETS